MYAGVCLTKMGVYYENYCVWSVYGSKDSIWYSWNLFLYNSSMGFWKCSRNFFLIAVR